MADDARTLTRLLPWQHAAWDSMQRLRAADRLPHALLLCGRAGMGKDCFALLFAHALLCEASVDNGLPCGRCRSCQLTLAGTHPDLHRCSPAEDKTSIGVDQIREIGQFLTLKPHYDCGKVVIISPADQMNLNAANSLLKMLEEPPPGTHLLLVSSRPAAIPPTVRSRCQRVFFAPAEAEAARDWLAAQPGIGADRDPAELLALAQGAPLAAAELATAGHLDRRRDMLGELRAIGRREADPLQVAENWLKFDTKASLYWLYGWLVDMIRLRSAERPPQVSNPDSAAPLSELASGVPLRWLYERLDQTARAAQMLDGSVNAQLLLEDVLLPWAERGRMTP